LLARELFRSQDRRKSGLVHFLRQVITCWISDGYYDAGAFEETLRTVFGADTKMFDYRRSGESTRVAVTATTISDALPYVFSNYNGVGERQGDAGKRNPKATLI